MWIQDEVHATLVGDGVWRIETPIVYRHFDCKITALDGFVTDFASIPAFYRWRFNPDDKAYAAAAVIHDILYQAEAMDRKLIDEIFRTAMSDGGTDWWTRNVMYRAVRLGGGFTWSDHTPESIKDAQKHLLIQPVGHS